MIWGIGFVSLEGYLAARIFTEGLKKAGPNLTRESLVDALEKVQNYDLGIGPKVSYSKQNHQAMNQIWPTVAKGGKFVELKSWKELTN